MKIGMKKESQNMNKKIKILTITLVILIIFFLLLLIINQKSDDKNKYNLLNFKSNPSTQNQNRDIEEDKESTELIQATLSYEPATSPIKVNEKNQLKIFLNPNNQKINLMGADLEFNYDPNFIQIESVDIADKFPLILQSKNEQNKIIYSAAQSLDNQTQTPEDKQVLFAVVNFTPVRTGETTLQFNLDQTKAATDDLNQKIQLNVIENQIKIE